MYKFSKLYTSGSQFLAYLKTAIAFPYYTHRYIYMTYTYAHTHKYAITCKNPTSNPLGNQKPSKYLRQQQ